jgi:hypothetical protein
MAGRLLRWSSYACLIGCGLLAASACLDPKSDDLPIVTSNESAPNPGEMRPDQGGQFGNPDLGAMGNDDPNVPPASAPVLNPGGPTSGAGGESPADMPGDAGSDDPFADAGSPPPPGVDVPNVIR